VSCGRGGLILSAAGSPVKEKHSTGRVSCGRGGLILYRTKVPASALDGSVVLDIGAPVHDYAKARSARCHRALAVTACQSAREQGRPRRRPRSGPPGRAATPALLCLPGLLGAPRKGAVPGPQGLADSRGAGRLRLGNTRSCPAAPVVLPIVFQEKPRDGQRRARRCWWTAAWRAAWSAATRAT